jgi:hypothetical protein
MVMVGDIPVLPAGRRKAIDINMFHEYSRIAVTKVTRYDMSPALGFLQKGWGAEVRGLVKEEGMAGQMLAVCRAKASQRFV